MPPAKKLIIHRFQLHTSLIILHEIISKNTSSTFVVQILACKIKQVESLLQTNDKRQKVNKRLVIKINKRYRYNDMYYNDSIV